jgi:hypothetical protein
MKNPKSGKVEKQAYDIHRFSNFIKNNSKQNSRSKFILNF